MTYKDGDLSILLQSSNSIALVQRVLGQFSHVTDVHGKWKV